MTLQKIFELVRKEDVVLWVGAGFSLYAGYPSGNQLNERFYKELSSAEKEQIQNNLSLIELTEEFVRLKGGSRNALNHILKDVFLKQPSSLKWHQLISQIPHFRTIVTTNYDNCFEDAFKQKAIKLVEASDIAYIDNKVEIFKIHGDLQKLDSIIITKTDYANHFFNEDQSNVYWNTVISRIACKSIVFLGYNFEDENIMNVFKKISIALGDNKKESFLIAPNIPKHKVDHLTRLGIEYLDFKGEPFVEKLYQNIKENIRSDFEKGFIKAETLREFLAANGIKVELESLDDKYSIKSMNIVDKSAESILSLDFIDNAKIPIDFSELIEGKRFGEVEIGSEHLKNFTFTANQVNLITGIQKDFKLLFTSVPILNGIVDIEFENGLEYDGISYSIFRSTELIEITSNYKGLKIVIRLKPENNSESKTHVTYNIQFFYEQTQSFKKISDALNAYKFILNLTNGKSFKVYPHNDAVNSFDLTFTSEESFRGKILSELFYYEQLKRLEDFYKVKFTKIGSTSNEDFEKIIFALKSIENYNSEIDYVDKEVNIAMIRDGNSLDWILKSEQENIPLLIEKNIKEPLEIHGQLINVNSKQVYELHGVSGIEIKDINENGKEIARIKFKVNKIREYFIHNS